MQYLIPLQILINFHITQGILKWTVIGKVTDYGQNVTLFCNVPNCCPKDSGWDRWTPVQRTLFIDVKSGYSNTKYDGKVLKDGYTLIIQNLTKQDLNVSYSCLYGVTLGERKLLLEEDVFTDISTTQPNFLIGNSRLTEGEIAGIVVGVLVLVAVTVVVFLIHFRGHSDGVSEKDENEQLIKDYFIGDPFDVECKEGEEAVLTCKVRPESPPLKWIKDSIEIYNDENYEMDNEDTQHHLKIKNTKSSDSGVYYVQVGKISRTLHLNVTEIPSKAEKKIYMEAIHSGEEVRQYVRIQVVGKGRAGKTSLVRKLFGETIEEVKSTDGIEITKRCKIKKSDGKWIIMKGETDEMYNIKMRILQTVNMKQGDEESYQPEGHELEKEMPSNSLKFNPSEDRLQDELNEDIPLQADGITVEYTTNKDESMTKYTNNFPGAANNNQYTKDLTEEDSVTEITDKRTKKPEEKRLKNLDPNPRDSRKGDQINESIIKNMDKIHLYVKNKKGKLTSDGSVECGIWDFAGQKDYYATHQTFFTQHAIYLLVANIMEDVEPIKYDDQFNFKTSGDYIDFWLDSIHCFCEDIQEKKANELRPPVIMVCTGIDSVADADKETKMEEYTSNFTGIFGPRPSNGGHIRGRIHFISNITSPDEHFENLKKHISEIAKEMHYFSEVLPTKWILLENALAILRDLIGTEDNEYCVKWESIEKLAKAIPIEIDDLLRFLNYQHSIGNIIFFEDKRDYIILQPNWLINCFKCLVCDPSKYPKVTLPEMYELKFWGRLSEDLIDKLFEKEPELKFGYYKNHILDVMGKFDIIVKPEFTDSYYMPCMIEKSSTLEHIKKVFNVEDANCTPWLVLEFTFLPISFCYHILFSFIRQYNICKAENGHPALYTGKAVISLDDTNCRLLIICFSKNAISLQIWKWNNIDDKTYPNILNALCIKIEELGETSKNNICYEIKAKCSIGDYSTTSDRHSYEFLTQQCKGGEYRCKEHYCQLSKKDLVDTWLKHAPAIDLEMKEKWKKRDKEQREQKEANKKKIRGISHYVGDLGKISAITYGDRNSTRTSESPTTVVEATIEETDQLRLNDTVLEKAKLQHRYIVKSKDAKIAELKQFLEQKHKEIENISTEIVRKDKDLLKREKDMRERNIEMKKKEDEIKKQTYDIRTLGVKRQKLHNQIQELKGNVRVFCRVRPLTDHEKRGNNCKINHISFPGPNRIQVKTSYYTLNEKSKSITFSFDKVFKHNATQDQVFREISQLVQSALDGYNVCIFAYGQTGSGKTFTMEGTSVNDDTDDVNIGMIPRSVLQIFDTIRKITIEGWKYSVDFSCLEIYGKEINDLLCEKKAGPKPEIQDVNNETRVSNITVKRVATEKEVYLLLQKASKTRAVAQTNINKRSSRSHSVYTLKLTGENSITEETSKSTLYLVDLAGSERTKLSTAESQQMKEAVAINQSLTTLGRVIRAIKNREKIIPYRESTLTHLLHYSLGGNSKTLMFVNVSPQEDCVQETLNSLVFAKEANLCKLGTAQQNY